jgi:hypothetical protein
MQCASYSIFLAICLNCDFWDLYDDDDFDDKNQRHHTNRVNHSSDTFCNTADENRKEPLSFCVESR